MPAAEPWVTVTEVHNALAHETDQPGWFDPDAIDDTEVTQAIANAQAEVTMKVSSRYTINSPELVPDLLRNATIDIAVYLLALQQRSGQIDKEDVVKLRYDRAVSLINGIAEGRYSLPPDDDGDGVIGTSYGATTINPYQGQLFGPEDVGLGHGRNSYRGGWWPDW